MTDSNRKFTKRTELKCGERSCSLLFSKVDKDLAYKCDSRTVKKKEKNFIHHFFCAHSKHEATSRNGHEIFILEQT